MIPFPFNISYYTHLPTILIFYKHLKNSKLHTISAIYKPKYPNLLFKKDHRKS